MTFCCDIISAINEEQSNQIKKTESTWFSSNEPLLLGSITFIPIIKCIYNNGKNHFDFYVDIIEYDSEIFVLNGQSKILYTKNAKLYMCPYVNICHLDPCIIIKPHRLYEIRSTKNSGYNASSPSTSWKSQVKPDDHVVIKFHKNPSDGRRHGIVASMWFSHIYQSPISIDDQFVTESIRK